MDVRDILYLLALTGPLFSISNLIGAKRTRGIELWILKNFAVIARITKGILYISVFSIIFIIAQILRIVISFLPEVAIQAENYSIALRIGIFVAGILILIGFVGLISLSDPDRIYSNDV